jgi:glycosyltransferase involved in cell wall biosynthesis
VRILHLSHGYPPAHGGSEVVMQQLSERLAVDNEVTVVTTTAFTTASFRVPGQPTMPEGEEMCGGVRIRRHRADPRLAPRIDFARRVAFRMHVPGNGGLRTLFDGPLAPGMLRDAALIPADVIGATAFPLLHMQFAVLAGRARRIPVALIGAMHPEDRWGYDRATIRRAIRLADAYVAYTEYEREHVLGFGEAPDRVHVIPPGVDIASCREGDRDGMRARLGIPPDERVVGFLGQIGGHKGVDDLIQAMRRVWTLNPDAYLVIAGAQTAFVAVVQALIARLPRRRQARVRLVLDVPTHQKADMLAAFDVFASPSGYESFGLTFIEAWAAGLPVIGCRAGAIPSVVPDGEAGLLVAYKSAHELAGAIGELLDDPAVCERFARAGSRLVDERYTWDVTVPRLAELYRDLVAARG